MEAFELTPELAKQILEAAAARGVSVEELLESVIENDSTESQTQFEEDHFQLKAAPEDWSEALRKWANNHPRSVPLSDYAVSRESIYTREDEML